MFARLAFGCASPICQQEDIPEPSGGPSSPEDPAPGVRSAEPMPAEAVPTRGAPAAHRPTWPLVFLAVTELSAVTLWFSATAVLPALRVAWDLSPTGAAWLTAAVQAGFVVGALGSAILNLPDVLPPRRMVAISAVAGAAANLV